MIDRRHFSFGIVNLGLVARALLEKPDHAMSAAETVHPDEDARSAQAVSVKQIFEQYNLLGSFAPDCSKPPNQENNWFYVNRVIDARHVQHDLMSGPDTRLWFIIIDQAKETGRNEIFLKGIQDGHLPVEGIWRIDGDRMLQWSAMRDGKQLISNGRVVATGKEMPWLNKCAGPSG